MTHPALPEQERQLGKYRIVRPLKVGGTAAIYLAVLRGENNFSREVVIKRPLPHLVSDARARLMFIDEAHLASRLSHPNICQVLDLVAREDELYLVLEYLKGVDLREILKRCMELGRLIPPEVAVWMAIEVCAGLDFAHEAVAIDGSPLNLIHRDVSPKNIRITDAGSVKVIDFGIARAMNRATETAAGTIKGTLGYMSPEQIMGDEIDCRSDIFAFGICLFQMLTCRNPFDGPTLRERVRRLTQAPVPSIREFNGGLDPEIEGIVARCLERDLDARYQRMRDIQVDLDRYLAKLQVVSPRQQLIRFLEDIFPDIHNTDAELKIALTEISSVTGRIDISQRISFPDDPDAGAEANSPSASAASHQPARRPSTVSTVKDQSIEPHDTAPLPRRANGAGPSIEDAPTVPRPIESAAPANLDGVSSISTALASRPVRMGGIGVLLAVIAALAVFIVIRLSEDSISSPLTEDRPSRRPLDRAVPERAVPERAAQAIAPIAPSAPAVEPARAGEVPRTVEPARTIEPPRTASTAAASAPPRTEKPPAKPTSAPPHTEPASSPPSAERARLYFRTGVRFDGAGRSDDALLMYTLAFAEGGKSPNPSIYRNLGVIHNKSGAIAKARACFRGYLERSPGAADADRIQTMLSSYPSTKSVPCVDASELAAARKSASRRGAVIDSWLNETVERRLSEGPR